MIVGTVKEIMNNEYRVGLNIDIVKSLVNDGHQVLIETNAGLESGISDNDYLNAGATILDNASDVWDKSDMVVKVKAPLKEEFKYLREELILFCYLHLAAYPELTKELVKTKTTAIAFETIETKEGMLPGLKPMSAIAGRLAVIIGADNLRKSKGGSGVLMTGLSNVNNSNAVILGAGNVGINALEVLVGFNTNITVLDVSGERLKVLKQIYKERITTLKSTDDHVRESIINADLIIGSASVPGASTPKLIKKEYYKNMKKGSVIVDVAIDQGGSSDYSRPTTHDNPTYVKEGIIHYCVPNIPGDVALTSTEALSKGIKKYVMLLANNELDNLIKNNIEIEKGINVMDGVITNYKLSKCQR